MQIKLEIYKKMTDKELLEVYKNKHNYADEVTGFVRNELLSRGVDLSSVEELHRQQAIHEGEEEAKRHELKRSSVIITIFLSIVTLGIYFPIWFLTRREAINNLQSNKKLGSGIFIFVIILSIITLLFAFTSGVIEKVGDRDTAGGLDTLSLLLNLVVGITLLIQSFKVRRIFIDHFNVHLKRNISFSGVATFFLQIYYLQYKINRF